MDFRVAYWLDFEQLSSYLFVYWLLFGFTVEKISLGFWFEIIGFEPMDILLKIEKDYLKSISSHIE